MGGVPLLYRVDDGEGNPRVVVKTVSRELESQD